MRPLVFFTALGLLAIGAERSVDIKLTVKRDGKEHRPEVTIGK